MRYLWLLLLVGCGYERLRIHLPSPSPPLNSNTTITVKNHESKPWIVGEDLTNHQPIAIDTDIGSYIKNRFLAKIKDKKIKVSLIIDRFFIVIQKSRAYGLAKIRLRLEAPSKLALKRIEVTPIYSLDDKRKEKLEEMVKKMADEIVKVMLEQYAMFTL